MRTGRFKETFEEVIFYIVFAVIIGIFFMSI